MKKFVFFLLVAATYTFCTGNTFAKTADKNFIEQDSILKKIYDNLPAGWSMIANDTLLIIERKDSAILSWHFDEINGPGIAGPTDEEIDADTKAHGQTEKLQIRYKLEPKWSAEKKQYAITHNDSIYDCIHKARDKYGIEKFYHRAPRTNAKMWDTDHAEPKTKADSINLEKYNMENERLRHSLIKLPELGTENYAMFADYGECVSYGRISYPRSAVEEQYKICELIQDFCDLRKKNK